VHADGEAKVHIDSLEAIDGTTTSTTRAIRPGMGGVAPGRTAGELAPSARW
jgi:hypothetical protein